MEKRTYKDREKGAYQRLLEYEVKQYMQEQTRESLGSPFGRAPPLKLSRLTESSSNPALSTPRSLDRNYFSFDTPHTFDLHSHRSLVEETPYSPRSDRRLKLEPLALTHSTARSLHSRGNQYPQFHNLSTYDLQDAEYQFTTPSSSDITSFNPFQRPHADDYFFPADMFMDLNIPRLPLPGLGKLKRSDGSMLWKPCTVLNYSPDTRCFEVQWPDSRTKTLLARWNLLIGEETEDDLAQKMTQVKELRMNHEGFVRYFGRFELALAGTAIKKTANFSRSEGAILRKISVVLGPAQETEIRKELWELYRRCVFKFVFDSQYFFEKIQLAACPWEQEYMKQTKWRDMLGRPTQVSFKSSQKTVMERLLNPKNPLDGLRQRIYRLLTVIRNGDYFHHLRVIRNQKEAMTTSRLNNEFKDRFSKDLRVIDGTIKQITDWLGKLLDEEKELEGVVDRHLHIAQVILESNLQYAVRRSIQSLIEVMDDYYPMLPLPGEAARSLQHLPDRVKAKHFGEDTHQQGSMSLVESTKLIKEIIEFLEADFRSGKLSRYSLERVVPPLLGVSIESKATKIICDLGRTMRFFDIAVSLTDRSQRRSKLTFLPPTSTTVIQVANQSALFSRLMLRSDECMLGTESTPGTGQKHLLSEEVFGWMSAGMDDLNLVLSPNIEEIEATLRTLAKAPLSNLRRILKFKRKAREHEHISARNAKPLLEQALKEMSSVLQYSLYGPVALLAILRHFEYLFSSNPKQLYESLVSSHIDDYAGFVQEIETISSHKDLIQVNLPASIQFGMLEVHLRNFKQEALMNAQILMEVMLRELSCEQLGILREVHASFESLMEMLSRSPESVEELADLQDFIYQKRDEITIKQINSELEKALFISDALERFNTSISDEQSELWWRTKSWGVVIKKQKTKLHKRLQKLIPVFRDLVQKNIEELQTQAETLKSDITEFVTYYDIQKAEVYAAKASEIMESLSLVKQSIETTNSRERRLGRQMTDFSDLSRMEDQFLVFNALWSFANEWAISYHGWMDKPLHLIDPTVVRKKFRRGKDLLAQLKIDLADNRNAMIAVEELTHQILGFETTVPLISNLREESLRDRHWKRIWELLSRSSSDKPDSERKESQTLRDLLITGVLKRSKEVELITQEAKHEFEIEKIWMGIEKELRNPMVELESHPKHPELQLLKGLAEQRDSLREAAATISYIVSANRYIEPFRESLRNLSSLIISQKTMVDDVYTFQALIEELYPIFKIQEIYEQQPRTADKMSELLSYYTKQLKSMQENHSFVATADGTVKTLDEGSQLLKGIKDEVLKKIAEKQSLNSRLHFLTDLQILTLMSEIAPNRNVDVEELFPGIEEVIIGEKAISRIVRSQETFDLPKRVVIFTDSHSPRNLEEWLADLDSSLKEFHLRKVLAQYKQFCVNGMAWDSGADNEAIYVAYMAWFTRQVTNALRSESVKEALMNIRDQLTSVLHTGISKMRPVHGTPGHGLVSTIVCNQFLRRDEALVKKKQNEMLAHMLISHLELLEQIIINGQEEDCGLTWKSAFKVNATVGETWESIALDVDCFDYVVPYGFEMHSLTYLQSFILTPTSERRLQHIFLTMKRGLGCMLFGPTGSEKTETLKHLALICGRLLQLCHITSTTSQDKVIKLIVGCALGGFWGCIDEIQSLSEASLCTILYYIKQISAAAIPNPPRVSIDFYTVKPKLGFTMFCASSAVDSPLPQIFHEQFRTLAVSKPDLNTTAAILLQTYGFEHANKYGGMIFKAMQMLETPILCFSSGETLNLSTKANTRTLIRLVRCMIETAMHHYINDMAYLINNAFRQIYGVGLVASHLAILDEYLATLFQSTHNDIVSQLKSRSMTERIAQVLVHEKVMVEETMQQRCQHLWWLLLGARRPWVILVGEPLSGKTETIRLLAKVVATLNQTNFKVHKIGAAAPPELLSSLYESLGRSTNVWFSSDLKVNFCSESVLPDTNSSAISPLDWIHVDSQSLPYTSDTLFTLIKSYPKADIRLIFETERLETASPSSISEAGILYMEDSEINQYTYFTICMRQVMPENLIAFTPVLHKMYHTVLAPVLTYMQTAAATIVLSPKVQIQQFSNLLKGFLPLLATTIKKDDETAAVPLSKGSSGLVILKHSTFLSKTNKDTLPKHKSILQNPKSINANVMKYLGGLRKSGSQIKPELCLEAMFLTCVLQGLGRIMVNIDGFSTMLAGIVQQQTDDFCYYIQKEIRDGAAALSDLIFSMKSMSWHHSIQGAQKAVKRASTMMQVETAPSQYDSTGVHLNIFSLEMSSQNIFVPTESSRRLSYWVEFCLSQSVDVLIYGPHQCGKTVITNTIAKELLSTTHCALIPFNVPEFTDTKSVQQAVQMKMENYRTFHYGGLGGTRYIAMLDDMNMDASNGLYDVFRFWKETGGWYGENFVEIEDLTLAFVHSYSEGKSRPMWLRAIRHFFLLHKESYSDVEITAIFWKFVDAQSTEEITEDLTTLIDYSITSLVDLFHELQLQHKRSEQIWCHISISNFMLGLKFLSQFDINEEVDNETYLKVWKFMYTRFFGDQFGNSSDVATNELHSIVVSNLSELIAKFITSKAKITEINNEGFMLPSASELQDVTPGLFHEFELVYEESIANVIREFHKGYEKCVKLYPEVVKNLNSLIFDIEHRFSVFYYFYLNIIYDMKSSCPSVIIKSSNQLFLIKALVYISATTVNMRVIEFNMSDQDDSFGDYIIESFHSIHPHYVSPDFKNSVKKIIEQAMIKDQKIVIVISLFSARQLDRRLSQKIMEIANDIITGVQVRLTEFEDLYKAFVDQFCNSSDAPKLRHQHTNEEVLQLMLDRMRMNTTLVFLIQSENEHWIRSPLHPICLLEKFKHQYRALFNKSRIVDFDHLTPPQAFENYLHRNPDILHRWKLDFHNELLVEIGAKLTEILKVGVIEEFVYESVIYCAMKLIKDIDAQKIAGEKTYLRAIHQINTLEKAVESTPAVIISLQEEISKIEQKLRNEKEKRGKFETIFAKELGHDYEQECQEELRQRKVTGMLEFEERKAAWMTVTGGFAYKHEDVKEAEKHLSNPSISTLLYLFSLLLTPHELPSFPLDPVSSEPYLHKFLSHLSKKTKETYKKIRKIAPEDIPDLSSPLSSLELGSISRLPRLIRGVFTVIEASQRVKSDYERLITDEKRIEEEILEIPTKVEVKLAEIKSRQMDKMTRINEKINKTQEKLTNLTREIEQISSLRPKLQKLVLDLKSNCEIWREKLTVNENSIGLGDCILSSFFLLKGMSLPARLRNKLAGFMVETMQKHSFPCQPKVSLSGRLMGNNKVFHLECSKKGIPESEFFRDNVAALQTILRLKLPFPLFYDPYEIATDYVIATESENGLLIGRVTDDIPFQRKLREQIVEGKPVLCIDPSALLLKLLLPLLSWKAQHYVALMRGVNFASTPLYIGAKNVEVNANFRLYIACRQLPSSEVLQLVTLINFDAVDEESWQAFTLLPLLKTLDEPQYFQYIASMHKQLEQIIAIEEAEREIIALLNNNDMEKAVFSEQLLENFLKAWRKMRLLPLLADEEQGKNRRSSFLVKEKSVSDLKNTSFEIKISPRDRFRRLLSEMYDFKHTLSICNECLKDYAVPEKILHVMVINSIQEYVRSITVPAENQYDAFADCMTYKVYVRISNSLSTEMQLVFTAFYSFYKEYKMKVMEKEEYLQVLDDIGGIPTHPLSQADSIQYLQTQYPHIFSQYFSPGSPAFTFFLSRELFSDAKVPDHLPAIHKYLLYAYLRPDLLSDFISSAAQAVLGVRFSWYPRINLDMYTTDQTKLPTLVFFQEVSPVPLLRYMAEARKVTLITTQPVLNTFTKTNAMEIRRVRSSINIIKTTITDNFGSSRWILIENLHSVSGLEAEVVTRFLLYEFPEEGGDNLRIWVVFKGRPGDHPQWSYLIKQCQRIIIPEPSCIREEMLLWHYTNTGPFYLHYRNFVNRRYWNHSALDAQESPNRKTRQNTRRSIVISMDNVEETTAVNVYNANPKDEMSFNLALLMCILRYRARYYQDLPFLWQRADAKRLLEDFLNCLPQDMGKSSLLNPKILALFCGLLAPQFSSYSHALVISLLKEVVLSEKGVLVVKPRDDCPPFTPIEYPLYQAEHFSSEYNLEILLNRYPSEDHLLVTGLRHHITAAKRLALVPSLLEPAAIISKTAKGDFGSDKEISRTLEKMEVVGRLKDFLKELLDILPVSVKVKSLNRDHPYSNTLTKSGHSFKAALAHTQDGFKLSDMRNSVLDRPPTLLDVLEVLEVAEAVMCNSFLRTVRKALVEMSQYLGYARSTLSRYDLGCLAELAQNKVPEPWLAISPFVSCLTANAQEWKKEITVFFSKKASWTVIDLTRLFAPSLLLDAVLRAAAVSFKKPYELLSFSAEFAPKSSSLTSKFQVTVTGLFLLNAGLNPDSRLLKEKDNGEELPGCQLTPVKLPKSIRDCPYYPEGVKILVTSKADLKGRRQDLASQVSGLLGRRSSNLVAVSEYVFVPVVVSTPPLWLLISSLKPQGHWSKKGTQVRLKSSTA